MSAKICTKCFYSEINCECETLGVRIPPTCSACNRDQGIYCIECASDPLGCHCSITDEISEWYCVNCDREFYWDETFGVPFEIEDDDTENCLYSQDDTGKWWYSTGSEVKCYCHVPKKLSCTICQVSRSNASDHWTPWVDITVEEPGTYPSSAYGYSGSWDKILTKCDHLMTPVLLKTTTVYASSLNDTRLNNIPDWGLYADWTWRPHWRNEHIDWKDLGLPTDYDIAFEQISYAFELAKAGLTVEIGCIGGHGRTGTILCCMAVLDGMTAQAALSHVETTYCKDIVETFEQEWFIKWFEATSKGVAPPEKPQPKFSTTTSACSVTDHFSAIKAGSISCKVTGCKTFGRDLSWFNNVDIKLVENKPAIGTIKDGYVYTADGWQATFANQLKDIEPKK